MPAGRPTEYTPEFCDRVLELMGNEGLSLTAAMGELGFAKQTAYDWQERHPEFLDAVKIGQARRQAFLERRMLKADVGPVVTSSIFALKNTGTGDWRDKQEVEHSGEMTVTSKEQRDAAVAAATRADG